MDGGINEFEMETDRPGGDQYIPYPLDEVAIDFEVKVPLRPIRIRLM